MKRLIARLVAGRRASRCPLCGSTGVTQEPDLGPEFLVCRGPGCCEILYTHELVGRATNRTRRNYAKENR